MSSDIYNPNKRLIKEVKQLKIKCSVCSEQATAKYHKYWVCKEHYRQMKRQIDRRLKSQDNIINM